MRNKNFVFLLLSATIIIRLAVFIGLNGGYDDIAYANIAWQISHGVFNWAESTDHYGCRYLVILPPAFAYKFFGFGDFSSVLFVFLCSVIHPLILWKLIKALGHDREGRLAALLLAVFPVNVIYGTMLFPDETVACLLTASVWLFLKQKNRPFFFSGMLLALATLTRTTVAPIAGIYILHNFLYPPSGAGNAESPCPSGNRALLADLIRNNYLWIAGFATAIAAEILFSYFLTGQWFWHIKTLGQSARFPPSLNDFGLWLYPKAMFGGSLYGLSVFGFYYPALLAALIFLARDKRPQPFYFPVMWLLLLFAVHEFGSKSLTRYDEIYKQFRYLNVLSAPACWILGTALSALWERKQSKLAAALMLFLALTSLTGEILMRDSRLAGMAPWKQAAAYLDKTPPVPLWTLAHSESMRINTLMERNRLCSFYDANPPNPLCSRPLSGDSDIYQKSGFLVTSRRLTAAPEKIFGGELYLYRLPIKKLTPAVLPPHPS